jgi:uncharacterized delta-60 repeat protein
MFRFSVKNISLFFSLTIIFTTALISQQWSVSHDESHLDDRAFGIVTDAAGNIYITGYVTRPGTGEDIVVIKYNSNKIEQWRRFYDGPGHSSDKAFGIVVDASNNIIVTGYSTGVGSQADFTTIKYNSTGTKLWEQRYNTPVNGDDRAWGIVVDRVGNIYVTGYITLLGTDIYTIKYNSNGVYIWGKVIESPGNGEDKAWGIVVDSLGNNIYLCGQTFNDTMGNDFTVARYDSSGSQIWLNKYNGPGLEDDKAFGIVVDRLNNIYVTGYSTGMNSGMDFTTIKYNNAGNILWVNRYNDTLINLNDKAFGIVVDRSGNSYVTGYTTRDTAGITDYLTMKINPNGETEWKAVYNGTGNFQDTAFAITLPKCSEGVYVTGGSSRIDSAGNLDAVTLKYTLKDGLLVDSSKFNGIGNKNDLGNCITADTSGNVYVGGFTETIADSYNIMLLKYYLGILIGIEQLSTKVPENYMLYQNYPNPFNPSTKIKFDIKRQGLVKLVIYDILGRRVAEPVNKILKTGTFEVDLNFQNLSSGIYFYELSADGYKQTKKMSLIK